MGRQIAIITTWEDELAIIRMVAELANSDVRVFHKARYGDLPKDLWVEDWETKQVRQGKDGAYGEYGIWPTVFRWRPRYRQVKPPCAAEVTNKWVFDNEDVAPAIEFSRRTHVHLPDSPGRLYWGRDFSATAPLKYDVDAFDRLVSALWRWIRKTGRGRGRGARRAFVMPGARRRPGKRAP